MIKKYTFYKFCIRDSIYADNKGNIIAVDRSIKYYYDTVLNVFIFYFSYSVDKILKFNY